MHATGMSSVVYLPRPLSSAVTSSRGLRRHLCHVLSRRRGYSTRTSEGILSFALQVMVTIVLVTLSGQCRAAPLIPPPSFHRGSAATRSHENSITTGSATSVISTIDTSRTTPQKRSVTVGVASTGATINGPRVARQLCTNSECCLITFMGTRSFFNAQDGLCEPYVTHPLQMMRGRESIEHLNACVKPQL